MSDRQSNEVNALNVTRLELRPSDAIVVRVGPEVRLSESGAADIKERVRALFPDHRVFVLAPGVSVEAGSVEAMLAEKDHYIEQLERGLAKAEHDQCGCLGYVGPRNEDGSPVLFDLEAE